jgi:hypothetical protein
MGKSKKKNKGKAGIDWEALTAVEPAGGGGSADAGGWQTGPAAMALDGEDGGAPSSSGAVGAPVTEMVMGGTDTQALARRGGSGGGKKHRECAGLPLSPAGLRRLGANRALAYLDPGIIQLYCSGPVRSHLRPLCFDNRRQEGQGRRRLGGNGHLGCGWQGRRRRQARSEDRRWHVRPLTACLGPSCMAALPARCWRWPQPSSHTAH